MFTKDLILIWFPRQHQQVLTWPTWDPDVTLRPLSALICDFFSSASVTWGRCCFAPSDPEKHKQFSARCHDHFDNSFLPYWVAWLEATTAQQHWRYVHLQCQSFYINTALQLRWSKMYNTSYLNQWNKFSIQSLKLAKKNLFKVTILNNLKYKETVFH